MYGKEPKSIKSYKTILSPIRGPEHNDFNNIFLRPVNYHNSPFICGDSDEIIEFHDSFNEGSSLGIDIGTPKVVTNIYANNVGAEIYAVISTFDSGDISVL